MLSRIKAKNFLSWSNLDFRVSKGVTLIDGYNKDDETSEGSGKSAILNALSWCLFGKLPKDTRIDEVIKDDTNSCWVEIELDSGVKVVRSRKPNAVYIIDESGNEIKGKDAKDTSKLIEDLIGLTFDTFCQTVYFAQNYDKKFITANQEEKGKILSEIQDLHIFDRARKLTLAKIKRCEEMSMQVRHSMELEAQQIRHIEDKIGIEASRVEQLKAQRDAQIRKKTATITELEGTSRKLGAALEVERAREFPEFLAKSRTLVIRDKIAKAQVNIDLLLLQEKDIDKLIREQAGLRSMGEQQGAAYKRVESDIKGILEFIQNPEERCASCNSVTGKGDVNAAQDRLKTLESQKEDILKLLTSISTDLNKEIPTKDEIFDQIGEIKKSKANLELDIRKSEAAEQLRDQRKERVLKINAEIKNLDKYVKLHQEDLELLKQQEFDSDDSVLVKLESEKEDLNLKLGVKSSNLEILSKKVTMLMKLKDGYKEVKSYVFNSILNEINMKTQRYVERLFEIPINIKFTNDNMKILTEVKVNGVERGLGLLSGGQFRRVNLASDLALSDIITARKSAQLGVLLMDEYYKDLSESSMQKCLELLEGRDQPIILIEHNSIFKNIISNKFFVELQGGTSYEKI